jgi:protein-S-isoprenylcysteine O-methyltransferase Ste14
VLQIFGVLSLNRSFGLVAAQREIKTSGLYRVVRHPLYASYVVIFLAYVAANTTAGNVILLAVTLACLAGRILREESHLAADPMYQGYMRRVRYRVVPLVF